MEAVSTQHYQQLAFFEKHQVSDNPLFRKVLQLCSEVTGISVENMLSTSLEREIIYGKYLAMYILYAILGYSKTAISRLFSYADHSTTVVAIQQINDWRGVYPYVNLHIAELKKALL